VLEALIDADPASDLIPKLARGLLAQRANGRWASTQENAFVLLALSRYFEAFEGTAPDFVERAWLGQAFVGETQYRGRTTRTVSTSIPLDRLAAGRAEDLVVAKEGTGRLYWRLGLTYAPQSLDLAALDRGFEVVRTYESVDAPDDVQRTADGSWAVRAGARVRVTLGMVAAARRYHVALIDPLPAGLEAINPDLATSGAVPPEPTAVPLIAGVRGPEAAGPIGAVPGLLAPLVPWQWYDDAEFLDESSQAYAALLDPGAYTFRYVARATTPGQFVVPPARAEELYHPETFGRTATQRVIVR
jgi:uncharacterized protein YfaS (alpha-2-macroglobulin family)